MRTFEQTEVERHTRLKTRFAGTKVGLTLVEALVIVAIVAVLFAMLLPIYRRSRVKQDWGSCIVHLRSTGYAFHQWAEAHNGIFPMHVSVTNGGTMELFASAPASALMALSNELNTPTMVWCPRDLGKTRASRFSTDFSNSNVSYALNMSAAPDNPTMFLASDRNITLNGSEVRPGLLLATNYALGGWSKNIHDGQGNVVFVDGHYEQGNSNVIQKALEHLGTTNRFVIP